MMRPLLTVSAEGFSIEKGGQDEQRISKNL